MTKLGRQLMTKAEYNRFMVYVMVDSNGCHIWTGALNSNGYAQYSIARAPIRAARAVWIYWYGPIPEEKQVDHLCRVKACVNPEHLEIVTAGENQQRAKVARRESWGNCCTRGHDLNNPNNIYVDTRGFQECKECRRENVRAWRARQKERG